MKVSFEKFYSEFDGKTVKDNGAEVEKTMIGKIIKNLAM